VSLDQLIKNCKRKDAKAQEELYKRYASALFSICLKYSPNYADAEDTLQDSFIVIFDKVGQYSGKGSFEGWLKRVTINTALQRYRKQSVLDIINEENIREVDIEVDEESIPLDFLLRIIQELPDRYRLVFNLYVLDGYSHKEIANMLEISEGTSKSNLARARNVLKDKIEASKIEPLRHTQTR
jgi:RNA polymerase sigma-70 factor (ECF subfamily)